jgi:hypothetical protein
LSLTTAALAEATIAIIVVLGFMLRVVCGDVRPVDDGELKVSKDSKDMTGVRAHN